MPRLADLTYRRLRRTWFGSVLALIGFAILTVAPVARHCAGIAARKGSVGGVICGWTPPLESPGEPGLLILILCLAVIVVVPLAFPFRAVVLATGIGSALAVIGLIAFTTISIDNYLALARLGLDITSEASSGLLAILPASAAWIMAGLKLG